MKSYRSTILLLLIFFIGLSLLLYPSFSDWWNSFHQSRAIATYSEEVSHIDDEQYDEIWNAAQRFNRDLASGGARYALTEEQKQTYNELLNPGGTGVMGYIEIPSIGVALPVYHGTDESILQVAIGHLEWTSMPVGGESTHCVVSGHRGLPSAKLFTDLDKLVLDDIFMFRIMDEILTYQVDQILIVEPHEVDSLAIIEGEDLCTLVTCTPYAINSHRLLVRGRRIDNLEEAKSVFVTADATQIEPVIVAPMLAAPILLLLVIMVMIPHPRRNKEE